VTFVDANIFLRVLTRDDPPRTEACEAFFDKLEEGSLSANTTEIVVAEVVYILSSSRWFRMPAHEITDLLRPIIALSSLRIPGKETIQRALNIYADYPFLDFEDALIIAHLERSGSEDLMSYDRHFDRVPGVHRIEP
jgi:predicted nucleic acid-binding protein